MIDFKNLSDKEWSALCLKENSRRVFEKMKELRKQGKLPTPTKEDLEDEPTALANSSYRERAENTPLYQLMSSIGIAKNAIENILEETGDLFYEEIRNELIQIKSKIEKKNG